MSESSGSVSNESQFQDLSAGEAAFMKFCLRIEDRFNKLESRIESKFEALFVYGCQK